LRLEIDSWRWKEVPVYIRAGQCLPVTCTKVIVRLRQPPTMYQGFDLKSNHVRFCISPDIAIAFGANVTGPGEETHSASVEIIASRQPGADERDAYERVLGDAIGKPTRHFQRHTAAPKSCPDYHVENAPGQWTGPHGVLFASWVTAAMIRQQVAAPSSSPADMSSSARTALSSSACLP
jgi:hypothetical protein